jgi:HK97 family phage prohead protease
MKMNKITKNFQFQPNSINEKERSVIVYASTKDIDRYGDTIEPTAFDVKKINEKPIPILFNHNPNNAIGKSMWGKITDLGLLLKVYISDKTQVAKDVWNLVTEGIITGASVGFIPTEYSETEKGYNFTKVDLLETSLTPIPANPEAVALMLKSVESDEMKELIERQYLKSEIETITKNIQDFNTEIEEIRKQTIPPDLTWIETEIGQLKTSLKISDEIVNGFNQRINNIETQLYKHKNWVTERMLEIAGKLKTIQENQLSIQKIETLMTGAIRRHIGKLD